MSSLDETLILLQSVQVRDKMKESGAGVAALPLLEQDLATILDLKDSLPCELSLRSLVIFALSSESHYWVSLALKWTVQGFPLDGDIVRLMLNHQGDKRIDQRLRQSVHVRILNG